MGIKLGILLVYFAIMVGIGLYCRKHATDVKGFVLGGRSVGPWLTAFAYGRICRICRTVRMEIWYRIHLDRSGKRHHWIAAGVGGSGQKNAYYDTASGFGYHAGIFRIKI